MNNPARLRPNPKYRDRDEREGEREIQNGFSSGKGHRVEFFAGLDIFCGVAILSTQMASARLYPQG